jgi:hypothetical protein
MSATFEDRLPSARAWYVPLIACRTCKTQRRADGLRCEKCDHYENEAVDEQYQHRKRLNSAREKDMLNEFHEMRSRRVV